jgi:hypothetical protein
LHPRAYRNLSSRTRIGLGIGLLIWGFAGLQLTPVVEEKLGLTPTEADKAALERMTPKIRVVPRDEKS